VKERKERGLPARIVKESGQDARAPFLDPYSEIDVHEHHLPHWQQGDVFYFVTYRLADAVPTGKLAEWQEEKNAWLRYHPEPWDAKTEAEYHRLFSARIDEWLDAGHGSCILRRPALASIVADAFHHFDGQRYDLDSFVVMPNHVHVLFRLRTGEALEKVVHSWKSFTAKAVNKAAGLAGTLWQEDYWDRVIRNERHLDAVRCYIARNPKGGAGVLWQRSADVSSASLMGSGQDARAPFLALLLLIALTLTAHAADAQKPNIVFILMDNLGYGEVGCYGGGIVRGAATPRIDKLATEGTRLTNFNVEAQCTPSRSAILTGRFSIRSGTHSVPIGGGLEGLTQWEVTIAELLSSIGYTTGHFGKWHLGSDQSRLPNAQGFDEWYGIPRTTDEVFTPSEPAAKAAGVAFEHIMEGKKGEKSRELQVYDLEQRRLIDTEITRRTIDFIKRNAQSGKRFYAYVPFTLVHFPTLPNPKFAGTTGYGDFPDSLAEMDAHVGEILDVVDQLQIRDNTIVVFTSDNGPEATWPWQGSSGPWRGYYFTHMEGSLRVPFIIRWPGKIPAGRVSNEIVHEVDTYTTLAKIAGASVPQDRAIDGVDQTDFLFGKIDKSNREGFPVFVADRLEAVKWKNWKVVFYDEQRDWWTPPTKLGSPKAFDLITDPKEEYPQTGLRNSWIARPAMKVAAEFEQSLKKHPPIGPGTPDPYTPPK